MSGACAEASGGGGGGGNSSAWLGEKLLLKAVVLRGDAAAAGVGMLEDAAAGAGLFAAPPGDTELLPTAFNIKSDAVKFYNVYVYMAVQLGSLLSAMHIVARVHAA